MSIFRIVLFSSFLIINLAAKANDFHKYLSYIEKAENSIIEDHYVQAQHYYDSSRQNWDKPFAVDLINALKVANLNSDYKQVESCAERLIGLGCPLSFFEFPDYLQRFRASVDWIHLMTNYSGIRRKFISNNDWNLRTTVEYLRAKDQCLRQLDPGYSYLKDSIYKVDDTIKTAIMHMFKSKFPNEYDYGVFLSDDTTLLSYEPLQVILLHNYVKLESATNPTANKNSINITDALLNAVHKGHMHPEEFALLNDRSGEYRMGSGFGQMALLFQINGKLYYDNQGDKIKDEIEKNRANLGLDNRDIARKKLIYDAKNNIHQFILKRSLFGITKLPGNIFSEEKIKKLFVFTGVSTK